MKVITLDEVIQGNVSSDASCLYLVREASIVFYIGQSSDPVERLRQHIGIASPEHQTRLGRLIVSNAPRSKAWQVELWTLADCVPYVGTPHYGIDDAEHALIAHFRPCLNLDGNISPTPLPAEYADPNPYRTEMRANQTYKACGRPVAQLPGKGHRQRHYCSDSCKQRAYLERQAQKVHDARRSALHTTYPAFASETIDLLDGFEAMGNYQMVERIAAVICAEVECRPKTCIADALIELGEQLNYCKLDFATHSWKVPAVLYPGRESWQRFAERAPAIDVKEAYEEALLAVASTRRQPG